MLFPFSSYVCIQLYMFPSSLQCQWQILYRNQSLSTYMAAVMFMSFLFIAAQSIFLPHKFSVVLPYLNFSADVSHIPCERQQIARRTYNYDSSSPPLLNPGLLCNAPLLLSHLHLSFMYFGYTNLEFESAGLFYCHGKNYAKKRVTTHTN
jgi:hypothetical protein